MSAAAYEPGPPGEEAPPPDADDFETHWSEPGSADPDTELAGIDPQRDGSIYRMPAGRGALRGDDDRLAGWISAIVDHDERALAAFYDVTVARVFGLVQRIVRRTSLAEEVVEDTYFQVWRQAARFEASRGSAMTWLLSIARSRAIDAVRHEARFQHDALDEAAPALACGAAGSDELLDLARHRAELYRALMHLGAQPRQLVSLAFFRGLSHEEIAAQTQLPLGTVKSQIRRALSSLRESLGGSAPGALAS